MRATWLEVFWTLCSRRWRKDWRARLGLETAPVMPGSVWIHGASVGECKAALALAEHVQGPVLVTADTPEGLAEAERLALHLEHVVCAIRPADHPWTLAPLWSGARARGLVFIEGAWWPQLASMAARAGVPVIRASAKVGPATRRWGRWGLYRRWVRHTTAVYARDRDAAAWFDMHQDAPVTLCGDLKLDVTERSRRVLPPRGNGGFVVGACTHPGEEVALWRAVKAVDPELGLLLAPRNVLRAASVVRELGKMGADVDAASRAGARKKRPRVVVIDTFGVLAGSLKGANVVFIGGTFQARIGGHSPIEAWKQGVPSVAGPEVWAHSQSFREAHTTVVKTFADLVDGLQSATVPPPAPTGSARTVAKELEGLLGDWAPEHAPRPWARPAAWAWRAWTAVRPRQLLKPGIPVVAVGSANARGAGKTTAGRWVARELAARGYRVGVIARGYRRTGGRGPLLYREGVSGAELGDDAFLYVRDGHEVVTGPDRAASCALILSRGIDLLVLEDGLQQGEIAADWSVGVVDADYPLARGPLPAGERRPLGRAPDVTVSLNGGRGACWVEGALHRTWYRGERQEDPPGGLAVFAGTGRPEVVKDAMGCRATRFKRVKNHAPIGIEEWRALRRWAGGVPLGTTAKDYARIAHHPGADEVWWLDQEATFPDPYLVLPGDLFPRWDKECQGSGSAT